MTGNHDKVSKRERLGCMTLLEIQVGRLSDFPQQDDKDYDYCGLLKYEDWQRNMAEGPRIFVNSLPNGDHQSLPGNRSQVK